VRLLFRVAVFVVDIPKSPVGKILRRLLVAGEYRSSTWRAVPADNLYVAHPKIDSDLAFLNGWSPAL
jgi:hypothetical protein